MANQLAEFPPTHNLPPLEALIEEELAPLKLRAKGLLDIAETACIIDDESASKVIDLVSLIRALERDVDDKRKVAGQPHLDAIRTINAAYGAVIQRLVACAGTGSGGGLRSMLTVYQNKKNAEAEAARQAAFAEQRRREEEAEALRVKAQEQADAGKSGLASELDALAAQEQADAAARRAAAIRPEPVRAQLGSLGSRREIAFTVTDARKALGWLLKVRETETKMALRELIGKQLRSMGVAAVEAGVSIPGVEARIETQAAIRR